MRKFCLSISMSVTAAMEWLLSNPEPEEATNQSPTGSKSDQSKSDSAKISSNQNPTGESEATGGNSEKNVTADVRPKVPPVSKSGKPVNAPNSSPRKQSKAQTILESFRAYKRRRFKPNINVSSVNNLCTGNCFPSEIILYIK